MRKILIITPTLGNSSFLSHTIKSVELFANDAVHVLVAPAAKVSHLQQTFPGVLVIAEKEGTRSLYDAVNQVATLNGAMFEGVSYINDDDVLCEGFKHLVDAWNSGKAGEVYYGRVSYLNPEGRRIGFIPTARWHWQVLPLISSARMPLAQQGLIMDFALWRRIGGFNLHYRFCADMCWFLDAVRHCGRFVYVDAEVAGFRLHASQLSKNSETMLNESREIGRSVLGLPTKLSFLAYAFFVIQNMGVYLSRVRKSGLKRSWEISDNVQ